MPKLAEGFESAAQTRQAGKLVAKKLGVDVFEEEPPTLKAFVEDAKYLGNPPLSDEQYLAVRHLEQVLMPETYPAMVEAWGPYWKPVRMVNFGTLQWGKGSGKDHICRIIVARVAHLLLCLKDPLAYYGMPSQDFIHILNVAASATQANRAFFAPLRNLVKNSTCFKGAFYARDGDEPGRFSIVFDKKHIELVSGHSMASTLEGLNLLVSILDEISAFVTEEEALRTAKNVGGREVTKTAESLLKMTRTSGATRFPETYKQVRISYPRFRGDTIQKLTEFARSDNEKYGVEQVELDDHNISRHYVSGPLATWDVNPRVNDKTAFREDYEEDPVMARGMYECDPDAAISRFFRDDLALRYAFEKKEPDPLVINYYWGLDETHKDAEQIQAGEKEGWQARFLISPDLYPLYGAAYALHFDMALSGDRAGAAMCHVRHWREGAWSTPGGEVTEQRPVIKVDFVTSFSADLKAQPVAREVQLRWARKLVYELSTRGFYVGLVTFDGWQSLDAIQLLNARGVESDKQSMDRSLDPWNALRDVMYDGRLEGYWQPRLVAELEALSRLPNGKVDHPPGGSKDEADALCGAVVGAIAIEGSEGEKPERADRAATLNMFAAPTAHADFGLEGTDGTWQL